MQSGFSQHRRQSSVPTGRRTGTRWWGVSETGRSADGSPLGLSKSALGLPWSGQGGRVGVVSGGGLPTSGWGTEREAACRRRSLVLFRPSVGARKGQTSLARYLGTKSNTQATPAKQITKLQTELEHNCRPETVFFRQVAHDLPARQLTLWKSAKPLISA